MRHQRFRMVSVVLFAALFAVPLVALDSALTARAADAAVENLTDPTISSPLGITVGPDAALWFTNNGNNSIGRIDASGAVTNFVDPTISNPRGIVAGPDGALWFTNDGNNSIGRIDPSTHTITNYTDPTLSNPYSITAGSDGALWFTNYFNGSIGRIDPSTHAITNFSDPSISYPYVITAGSDGALWFSQLNALSTIGRITTDGTVSHFTDPTMSDAFFLAPGADGALWFTNSGNNSIGRITTGGIVTNYTDPSISGPASITAGSDGALWFTNYNGSYSMGRITTGGTVTNYTDPGIPYASFMASGPDGALWLAGNNDNSIGRFSQPSVAPATVPVAAQVTAPNDAVWSVPITNPTGNALSGVTALLDANADGSTPLGFHESLMPGCSAGEGGEECALADIPAHSTALFNVLVPTTGLAPGTIVSGDITVIAPGEPDTSGTLGAVTVEACVNACVEAVALPGVPAASSPEPPSDAHPTKQQITLPADQPGAPPHPPIAVTFNSIAPAAAPIADRSMCPVTGTQTRCSGQISVVVGDFSAYTDRAHPITIKIYAKWPRSVPPGSVLMKKDTPGPPIQLPACVLNATTHRYNTPCARPQYVAGSAANHNLTTTNAILLNGNDVHFARRVVVGPNAPTLVKAVAGLKKAVVSWKAPTVANGAITGYSVVAYISGVTKKTVVFSSTAVKHTITSLLTGKTYTFKVIARNAKGTSFLSIASNTAKPT